jgi:hypothetical protein
MQVQVQSVRSIQPGQSLLIAAPGGGGTHVQAVSPPIAVAGASGGATAAEPNKKKMRT